MHGRIVGRVPRRTATNVVRSVFSATLAGRLLDASGGTLWKWISHGI